MAVLPAGFVMFLLYHGVSGYTLRDDIGLFWPSEYHFKGEEINFLAKVTKPFEMWYSSSMNRSRIDYYGGTDKIYYYADRGFTLNIHPITDQNLDSEIACIGEETTEPQKDFLPDASDFIFIGTDSLSDRKVDVWKSEKNEENKFNIETIVYVYKNKNEEDVPVRKEYKKFNFKSGALVSHEITDYYNFQDTFSDHELAYEDLENCAVFMSDKKELDDSVQIQEVLNPVDLIELDATFDEYTKHHKKSYNEKEREMRKTIFEQNMRRVREVNAQNLGYKLALNEFSDQTDEETSYLTGTIPSDLRNLQASPFPHSLEEIDQLAEELPENFDLRLEGVISPVKNQGRCGSCWSFCTTSAVEGALARTNGGRLVDLSEQSLVDCAWGYGPRGCKGGIIDGAFKYVLQYGIPTEEKYGEYKALDGACNLLNVSSTYTIRGFAMVTPEHPNALKLAVYKYGPVVVGVHASEQMKLYSSGIFYDFTCDGESQNHGVTVVGYGVRDGVDYWIVKNSWGESWGEDGYILMASKNDNCLVMSSPFYPIV